MRQTLSPIRKLQTIKRQQAPPLHSLSRIHLLVIRLQLTQFSHSATHSLSRLNQVHAASLPNRPLQQKQLPQIHR